MEVREKYVARLLNNPDLLGITEAKFVHRPQIITAPWVRQRCQYVCHMVRQSDLCPPFSPTAESTTLTLDDYKFGLMVRHEHAFPFAQDPGSLWEEFQNALVTAEAECFKRGYGKAFAIGAGNCLFCHHDDSLRPCDFPHKRRPTLEAIGINLHDTMDLIGWKHHLQREPDGPFQFFGLLLLE